MVQILIYVNLAICLILAILARCDFIGILIGIYVFVLFIIQNRLEILEHMKNYLKINLGAVVYDAFWILSHKDGYFSGSSYDYAELPLKRITYVVSIISFFVKIALLISLWIAYDKASKKDKNIKPLQK